MTTGTRDNLSSESASVDRADPHRTPGRDQLQPVAGHIGVRQSRSETPADPSSISQTPGVEAAQTASNDGRSEWERQFAKTSLFTTRDQLQTMKDIALEKTICRIIGSVSGIKSASVTWARSSADRWRGRNANVTATVSVEPDSPSALTFERVHSVREAVARMIPDLAPENVTVFDQSIGRAFSTDAETHALDRHLIETARDFERLLDTTLAESLAWIDDIQIDVAVDPVTVRRAVRSDLSPGSSVTTIELDAEGRQAFGLPANVRRQPWSTRAAHEIAPAGMTAELTRVAANAVRISIGIPDRYLRGVHTADIEAGNQRRATLESVVRNDALSACNNVIGERIPDSSIRIRAIGPSGMTIESVAADNAEAFGLDSRNGKGIALTIAACLLVAAGLVLRKSVKRWNLPHYGLESTKQDDVAISPSAAKRAAAFQSESVVTSGPRTASASDTD